MYSTSRRKHGLFFKIITKINGKYIKLFDSSRKLYYRLETANIYILFQKKCFLGKIKVLISLMKK